MPQRLAPIVAPVCFVGLALGAARGVFVRDRDAHASSLIGVAALLAASTLASRYPVPIEGPNSGGVSLSFVFAASAIVLFGWDAGVLVAFAAPVLIQLTEHRPLIRIATTAPCSPAPRPAAALLVSFIPGDGTDALIGKVGVSASDPVRAQPDPDLARRRRDVEATVLRADQGKPALDDHRSSR